MKTILCMTSVLLNLILQAQSPTLKWVKQVAGSSSDFGQAITFDAAGNVYTTGSFSGIVDFDPGPGVFNLFSKDSSDDIFISKLDASGNFVWARQIGSSEYDEGMSVAVDQGGNVYVAGHFYDTTDFDPGPGVYNLYGRNSDIFILKLDVSGNFVWAKSAGGTDSDQVYSIALNASGDIYMTGSYYGKVDFDPGSNDFSLTSEWGDDVYIWKLDASGKFVWAKGLNAGGNIDEGRSVYLDKTGNVYVTGHFGETVDMDPGPGKFELTALDGDHAFIVKLDASGNFVWGKSMGGTIDYDDEGNSIMVDGTGNVLIAGSFRETTDFDPGAGTFNLTPTGYGNSFIMKLDASGNFAWAKMIEGTDPDADFNLAFSLGMDAAGNIYTAGFLGGSADFDPGAGSVVLSNGYGGTFILKLDAAGNFVWAEIINGDDINYTSSMAVSPAGNIYLTGFFQYSADFQPGADSVKLTTAGDEDIFILKWSQGQSGIKNMNAGRINVYPNPTYGIVNLGYSGHSAQYLNVKVYDISGLMISQDHLVENLAIDLSALDAGFYIIQVLDDQQIIYTEKVVKLSF
jgi:hypothetical protein